MMACQREHDTRAHQQRDNDHDDNRGARRGRGFACCWRFRRTCGLDTAACRIPVCLRCFAVGPVGGLIRVGGDGDGRFIAVGGLLGDRKLPGGVGFVRWQRLFRARLSLAGLLECKRELIRGLVDRRGVFRHFSRWDIVRQRAGFRTDGIAIDDLGRFVAARLLCVGRLCVGV